MKGLSIDFCEIFLRKHGNKVFQDICNQIKKEDKSNCDTQYIKIVFAIAFLTYIGLDDINKIHLLGNIPKNIDINNIKNIHKESIRIIQNYIVNTNNKNIKK